MMTFLETLQEEENGTKSLKAPLAWLRASAALYIYPGQSAQQLWVTERLTLVSRA